MKLSRLLLLFIVVVAALSLQLGCGGPVSQNERQGVADCFTSGGKSGSEQLSVLVLGDSIAAHSFDNPGGWLYELNQYFIEKRVSPAIANLAVGASGSYMGFIEADKYPSPFDIAIICYGENDPDDQFTVYYESMLRSLRQKNPDALIICILESSQKDYTYKIRETIRLASLYNAVIADMIRAFDESGYKYDELTDDGVHPNLKGQEFYYLTIKKIIESVRFLQEGKSSDGNEYFGETINYERTDFERVNEKQYELYLEEPVYGIMGLAYMNIPGTNDIRVVGDSENVIFEAEWYCKWSMYKALTRITEEPERVDQKICVEFRDKTAADNFLGLYITQVGGNLQE